MKPLLLALILLLLPIQAQDAELPAPPDDVAAALDNLLNRFLEDGLTPASPGAVLLVQTPDWRYLKAVGDASLDEDVPITPDMRYEIGSNTKTMVSTVILQLHEEGALDVDDPLSVYLPDIAERLPNGTDITLRQLLKHRSGLWDYADGTRAAEGEEAPADGLFYNALADPDALIRDYTPQVLIDFVVENGTPEFAPDSLAADGTPNFAYSNTGYLLLGLVIEQVTGMPAADVLAARIFEPLGMADTRMETGVPDLGSLRGYYENEDVTDFNLSLAYTAGAVVSTPEDMAVFITALLNGNLFQDAATLDLMLSDPLMNAPTNGDYAMGIQDKSGYGLWAHGGATPGFESEMAYDLGSATVIIAWTNGAPSYPNFIIADSVMNALRLAATPSFEALADTELRLDSYYDADTLTLVGMSDVEAVYSLVFDGDGSVSIQADCNTATASYTYVDDVLTITPGAVTLAACGPDSFSEGFLAYLAEAKSVSVMLPPDGGPVQLLILTTSGNSMALNVVE